MAVVRHALGGKIVNRLRDRLKRMGRATALIGSVGKGLGARLC